MQTWEMMQAAVDRLEEHLREPVSIGALASHAGLSPFYFQRLFRRLTGHSVMEYAKLRRLALADSMLPESDRRIVDIALECGFENHETFTRAFSSAFGLTPEEQRRRGLPLRHLNKAAIALQYQTADENLPLIVDGFVLEIRRQRLEQPRCFAGISTEAVWTEPPQPDPLYEHWMKFHGIKHAIPHQVSPRWEIGAGTAGQGPGSLWYLTGVEVTQLPIEGFEGWTLPPGEYAVCLFEAEDFTALTANIADKALPYFWGTWLPSHKLRVGSFLAELYPSSLLPDVAAVELWSKIEE